MVLGHQIYTENVYYIRKYKHMCFMHIIVNRGEEGAIISVAMENQFEYCIILLL